VPVTNATWPVKSVDMLGRGKSVMRVPLLRIIRIKLSDSF
jgi:hypothetical protein